MELQYEGRRLVCGGNSHSVVLSQEEMRVAKEFCKGYSDKEVADHLCKSYWTVKTQKKMIYQAMMLMNLMLLHLIQHLHRLDKLHEEPYSQILVALDLMLSRLLKY